MSGAQQPAPRTIGPVTTGSTVGSVSGVAVGQALASLVVLVWPAAAEAQADLEFLLGVACTLLGGLLGGYLVRAPEPPEQPVVAQQEQEPPPAAGGDWPAH